MQNTRIAWNGHRNGEIHLNENTHKHEVLQKSRIRTINPVNYPIYHIQTSSHSVTVSIRIWNIVIPIVRFSYECVMDLKYDSMNGALICDAIAYFKNRSQLEI